MSGIATPAPFAAVHDDREYSDVDHNEVLFYILGGAALLIICWTLTCVCYYHMGKHDQKYSPEKKRGVGKYNPVETGV